MKKLIILIIVFLLVGCGSKNSINHEKENKMIDLSKMTKEEITEYAKENNLVLEFKEVNNNLEQNKVISQSIKKDTKIKENDSLVVEISLGRLSTEEYTEKGVNELGRIPVMMYHGIQDMKNSDTKYTGGNIDKDGYHRTTEAFRNDLEFYYKSGYRMIRLEDYINGKIDVELGLSPIVITFDDGLKNNINVLGLDEKGEIIIDPNSAVGILEEFKKKYPDYNVTATFFVNGSLFNQPEYNDKILSWLINNGYDIGNHTYTHVNFKTATVEQSIKEVGSLYQLLDKYIKGKYVKIVALPFGSPGTMEHANFKYILSGTYNNIPYTVESCLRVGWEADYSPFSGTFNKQFIKRIRAYDNNGVEFDIEANFKILENNKYISDGNINNVVISKENEKSIGELYNLNLVTY